MNPDRADSFPEIDAIIAAARQAFQEDIEQVAVLCRELEERARAVGYAHGLGMARLFQTIRSFLRGANPTGIADLLEVLEESRARQDAWLEGETLAALGVAYVQQGNYNASFECKLRAAAVCRQSGDHTTLVRTLNNLGNDYFHLGDNERGTELFLEALEISRRFDNRFGEAFSLSNLATTFRQNGDFDRALEYTEAALPVAIECGHKVLEADIRRLLGGVYSQLSKYEQAEELLQTAYELADRLGNAMIANAALLGMGHCRMNQGRLDEALEIYQRALTRTRETPFPRGEMRTLCCIGQLLTQQRQFEEAHVCFARAEELNQSLQLGDEAVELYDALTQLGEAEGNLVLALDSYRKRDQVREKLQGQTEHRRIAAITSKFEVERAEREARAERLKNQRLLEAKEELQRALEANQALVLKLQAQQKELERLATEDALTGLYNRRYFEQQMQEKYQSAVTARTALTVALVDIDSFKKINDCYGHAAGDRVLKRVASVLNTEMRGEELVARYGGEEFAVLLPYMDATGATFRLNRLVRLVAALTWPEIAPNFRVTVSMGFCDDISLPGAEKMIRQADEYLYRAKAGGKNQVLGAANPRGDDASGWEAAGASRARFPGG